MITGGLISSTSIGVLASSGGNGGGVSGDFSQIGWLIGGAAIGAAFSYVTTRLNARHDPKKKLSWEAETDRGLLAVSSRIRDNVSISYKGLNVEDIVAVKCTVANTGNTVVKNEQIRFSFPGGVRLLEGDFSPMPEPELHSSRLSSSESGDGERAFMIGHLEVGQQVSFELIATGNGAEDWKIHPFNEDGDVEFRQREAGRIKDDQEHIVPFVVYVLLLIVVPLVLQDLEGIILYDVSNSIIFLVRIVLIILLTPHVLPVARLVRRLVEKQLSPPVENTRVVINGGDAKVVASNLGRVDFIQTPGQN